MQAEALVFTAGRRARQGPEPPQQLDPGPAGQRIDWYVEAAANPVLSGFQPTDLGDNRTSTTEPLYTVSRAEVARVHPEVFELAADVDVLRELMLALPIEDGRRMEIAYALERAMDALDVQDVPGTAGDARAELVDVLSRPAHASAHQVSAVGHAHIDSAWLWPVRETVRKVARTAANVAHLIDESDDLVHVMSSAQQWEWLQEHHPQLFARVREQVDAGRFVPVGGMWVESDTNMVGGEAMARQFVMGKQWFMDNLGVECEEVWLPDSFGYTAALPQIVKLAGFRWFLTQKISWNTVNRFPHHTFWWEGIDGTRVFTHFPPADTYNGTLSGSELARAASELPRQGGGVALPDPVRVRRRRRRTDPRDARPRASYSATSRAPRRSPSRRRAPSSRRPRPSTPTRRCGPASSTWRSTAAPTRRRPGRSRGTGVPSTCCVRRSSGRPPPPYADSLDYPYAALRAAWKTVLLQQFHDILPGSSIAWVHREAADNYARVAADLEAIIEASISALAGEGSDEIAFNAAPGFLDARVVTPTEPPGTRSGGRLELDNGLLRVRLDDDGVIRSIRDLTADREVLAPGGAANLLQIHPDVPIKWDAWDLDRFYRNKRADLTSTDEVTREGDTIVVRRTFGDSSATQRISLRPGARQVDFETEVDWHEREKVLKVAFDVDVHTDHARYETQFGHVVRPTHQNTSWDAARFEVCAHRWVQVEEAGYGVAVANDATYGHDVSRHARDGGGTYSTVRLSLLRAPRYPDPETDQGSHRFRYALVPGARRARSRGGRVRASTCRRVRRRGRPWSRWSASTATCSWRR